MTGRVDDPSADEVAVTRLYDEHATALWRYVLELTRDHARAEGIVQETLLRAWQHPAATDNHEYSARAWLFTVARNLVVGETRSPRFRREPRSSDVDGESALDRLLVTDALARLSPQHRAVIRRAYYQGWTTAQIAADLDIVEGTVKSQLFYAVRALRLELQEKGYAGRP